MRKIRLGKDIRISWRVRVDGGSRDLAGLDLTLELHDERRRTVRTLDFTTAGDKLFCTVRGRDQAGLGAHSLTLWLNRGKDGQSVLDASDAFCLVPRTEMEGGTDNDNLATETVELAGDLSTDSVPHEVYERIEALEEAKVSLRVIGKTIENVTVPVGDTKNVQEDLGIPDGYEFLAYRGIATERVQAFSAKKHISFQTFGSAGGGKKCNITFYNNGTEDEILRVNLQVVCYKIG